MPIGPESLFDGNQSLFALGMKGARVVLKKEVVLDDARFHLQVTGHRLQVTGRGPDHVTKPLKSINSPAGPIGYWLLTICGWLFEGKQRIALTLHPPQMAGEFFPAELLQPIPYLPAVTNPTTANDNVIVVEHYSLTWSDGTLGRVKTDFDVAIIGVAYRRISGLMAVADLGLHTDRGVEALDGNPVQLAGDENALH